MTFKQLEAIFWVATLGGFAQAAARLHTTQSAISKRIQEFESQYGTPLFDRSARSATLTEKGGELFLIAKRLLEQRDAAVEQVLSPLVVERHVRIGVTELTAMTWLPRLVQLIEQHYPRAIIEPDVDASVSLREKLLADELDLIIVPDALESSRFARVPVGRVKNAWMCKPGTVPARSVLTMHELAQHRLLTQGGRSGTGRVYEEWLRKHGVRPASTIVSNNLVAIIGMTVSGLGVSHLPVHCLDWMVRSKALQIIRTTPQLPDVTYVAAYKQERPSRLVASMVKLAQESCDFTRLFQA